MKKILFLLIVMNIVSSAMFAQTPPSFDRGETSNAARDSTNNYPDTLFIGAYVILVEAYDKGGEYNPKARTYFHLNGTGRVRFSCSEKLAWPGLDKDANAQPVSFKVAEKRRSGPLDDNSAEAASRLYNTRLGSKEELMMPHYNGRYIDYSPYLPGVKAPVGPQGILVRFSDLSVKVARPGATQGFVLSGVANYPTRDASPRVPFKLNISPGFQLEVSAVTIFPGADPVVNARLILPPSITQNSECSGGRLNLGNFTLSPGCEFYKELPDSGYGAFGVGNTTLAINGKGYVVDFSSTNTYGPSGEPLFWKGVTLMTGESKGSPLGSVISNIGYMQADYTFTNGIIEAAGLTADLQNVAPYAFSAAQPFGYDIAFDAAKVNVAASVVAGGALQQGKLGLPKTAVREANDARVILTDLNLTIRPSMDLAGFALVRPDQGLYWGDLIAAGGRNRKSFGVEKISREVGLFFSARLRPVFNPTSANGKKFSAGFTGLNSTVLDSFNMQGATFSGFQLLVVNSPNVPTSWDPNNPVIPATNNPIWFRLNNKDFCWMNVATEGVHCSITGDIIESPALQLGDPSKPLYVGITPFQTVTNTPGSDPNSQLHSRIVLQCVESAVITCDFRSFIKEAAPVNTILAFKEMVFTSTANNAGGKLAIQGNDSLSYWGLRLVPKPGFSSAGLVSVKTGQIILSASGLAETRHFEQPFWLTWGEMLANGSMGRLFFDYNSAGQKFDKFNYIHNAVALSPVDPDPAVNGYLRVGGTAFFPFFGGDYLHIKDTYTPSAGSDPFNGRTVTMSSDSSAGFAPTDSTIGGNWSNSLGIFNFIIKYAASTQDGFLGTGTSAVRYLLGGDLSATLDMNSRGTCMRIGSNLLDQRSISLGPVANVSHITRIWGCVCIKNDAIEDMVVGGELTDAANVSIAARVGSYLSAVLQVNPSLVRLTVDGEAYMSIAASLDALVNGHMQLTLNYAQGYLEGEVQGKFRVAEGSPILVGSSLQAEGQLNWHLGVDFNELQGMVELKVLGFAGGTGVGAGFYIGTNAPKSRAWVLVGTDPRFALNTAALPNLLTGIYGSFHLHQGVNLYVVSGDYDIYVGLGAFVLPVPIPGSIPVGPGLPYVVGNLGGRIHGEILGGLVSAGAYFNLQLIGPIPFSFQGTVGLEACVLWVACGSVDLTVGLNSAEGFFIR